MQDNPVIIWGRPNCAGCILCKQACESLSIPHIVKNTDGEDRQEFMEKYPGIMRVPLIEWNGVTYEGHEKFMQAIEQNLNNYGDGKL